MSSVTLFLSYAREDERLKDDVVEALSPLHRAGLIEIWHDTHIAPGTPWDHEIKKQLEEADIIMLLISPSFFASDYVWGVEMTYARRRHALGEAQVIPVIVRPVSWEKTPLAMLQALPRNGVPVSSWQNQDEALADIAREVQKLAVALMANRSGDVVNSDALIAGAVQKDPILETPFVWIPPGTFTMGRGTKLPESIFAALFQSFVSGEIQPEGPAHTVTLTRGFWMSKYQVTQKVWGDFVAPNPSHFRGDHRPVDSVTWLQACDFLERITARSSTYQYRLPTEAEWEYAARAGTTDPLHGVSAPDVGWWEANANGETHPVGQKTPNRWGLHDMLGNVWEWCSDWCDKYYSESPLVDPKGPDAGVSKVQRGGAFNTPYEKLRVSIRHHQLSSLYGPDIGFRCVRVVK